MSLNEGTRLGPYEIGSPVGAGGMGEVYRARDTRLDRTVAIKILPRHLSENPEARERFEREARAISGLNHPNVCQLYDVGEQDGTRFLVMEFTEGETLAGRLKRGPLPLEQVLIIGAEIADGLEHAHGAGVAHRDLKPGNIMLTKSGAKILDFGLAKALDPEPASHSGLTATISNLGARQSGASDSDALTGQGAIVGTVQYMSPEQIEAKPVDERSDIFALGVVLYEMATGKRAFEGATPASTMAAILERIPAPISTMQPLTPEEFDWIVKICLAKKPEDRWQSAQDVRLQLRRLAEAATSGSIHKLAAQAPGKRKLRWAAAGLILLLGIGIGWGWMRSTRREEPELHLFVLPPDKTQFRSAGNDASPPILSPDGERLMFGAGESLWIRSLEDGSLQELPGTKMAIFAFWSADGRSIGFFQDGKLKTVDLLTGNPATVCAAPAGRGGTWGAEGTILLAGDARGGISKVPSSGGTPVPVTHVDESRHTTHRWPSFLPDGQHFLYLATSHDNPHGDETGIYVGSLDGRTSKLLVHSFSGAIYANGFVFYVRQENLMAQQMNMRKLELEGEPIRVLDKMLDDYTVWRGVFSVSNNGRIVYQSAGAGASTQLQWFDRTGRPTGTVGEPSTYFGPELSHDGKRLSFGLGEPAADVWVVDLARGTKTRLSFGSNLNSAAVWSPDDSKVAYMVNKKGNLAQLVEKRADGAGTEELIRDTPFQLLSPTDWSASLRRLALDEQNVNKNQVVTLAEDGTGDPTPVSAGAFAYGGKFSPDGHWLAYVSNESGQNEVFVTGIRGSDQKWQISTGGGTAPRWRQDGTELYYASNGALMAVSIRPAQNGLTIGAAQPLFRINMSAFLRPQITNYTVTADGQHFLVNTTGDQKTLALDVILNWQPQAAHSTHQN
jgi:serine/threonine protein kinase/Tol biopolymer transport system component